MGPSSILKPNPRVSEILLPFAVMWKTEMEKGLLKVRDKVYDKASH